MGRIIVIEDNPVFRDHVCGMLEKAGYKTRTAYDCAGARRLLEELDDGDIIVSDLRLPDGECTEVLERMRECVCPTGNVRKCWSGCGKRVSETRLSS